MKFFRYAAILLLLAAAAAATRLQEPWWLAAALPAGFVCFAASGGKIAYSLAGSLPVAIFALILMLMQWATGMPVTTLAGKTVAVFWFLAAACRITPRPQPAGWIGRFPRLASLILFGLFTAHFIRILGGESLRLLRARRLSVASPYGRWAFRSLAAALTSLFSRSLRRAERFYAAQLLKGYSG
jgi:energy-coupling factor transporter transmembrane protein EcfT